MTDDDDVRVLVCSDEGRSEVRAMVDRMVARGVCSRPKCGPPLPANPVKFEGGPEFREALLTGRLVAVGRLLGEPFNRADLAVAAKISPSRASGAMTAWRKRGWVAGNRGKWVRTGKFGKTGEAAL